MTAELLEQVRALAPWHMSIALTPEVRTVDGNRPSQDGADPSKSFINPAELRPVLQWLYPSGLAGKRFLDCACNAGGYSLLASDLGAYAFGFDVREHWIAQARFLKHHFGKSDDEVRFEVCDLFGVDERLGNERFDICLFKGIFYHLPDPIAGLKSVADRTDEVLIIDTAAASGFEDGFLKLVWEGVENPMSGVHRLAWHPTGPSVLSQILEWLGFVASRVLFWRQSPASEGRLGRIRIVGARNASLLPDLAAPTPSIIVPRDDDILSATRELKASISANVIDVNKVEFHLTDEDGDTFLVGIARPSWVGWLYDWDTSSVKNGTYTLRSLAFNFAGDSGASAGVRVTVQN